MYIYIYIYIYSNLSMRACIHVLRPTCLLRPNVKVPTKILIKHVCLKKTV